jgi:hypothetical protein
MSNIEKPNKIDEVVDKYVGEVTGSKTMRKLFKYFLIIITAVVSWGLSYVVLKEVLNSTDAQSVLGSIAIGIFVFISLIRDRGNKD